jgi:hypothetical protein
MLSSHNTIKLISLLESPEKAETEHDILFTQFMNAAAEYFNNGICTKDIFAPWQTYLLMTEIFRKNPLKQGFQFNISIQKNLIFYKLPTSENLAKKPLEVKEFGLIPFNDLYPTHFTPEDIFNICHSFFQYTQHTQTNKIQTIQNTDFIHGHSLTLYS